MNASTPLACKCLNINLDVDANGFKAVDPKTLLLSDELTQDIFFNQEIQQVLRLTKVTKRLPSLTESRSVGEWQIEHCLNCNVHTHAVMTANTERGASLLLVNAKLLTKAEIEAVRMSNSYSKIFKINILPNTAKDHRYDYLPAELEKQIRALKQKVDESINRETQIIEERIRIYTEEQLQMLNDFKERSIADQKTLTRAILRHQLQSFPVPNLGAAGGHAKTRSTNNVELKADAIKPSSLRKVPEMADQVATNPSPNSTVSIGLDQSPNTSKHIPLQKTNSLDAECLFDIEGMDDSAPEEELEESDNDDSGIPIKQNRAGKPVSIAKSLPMDIPVYLSAFRSQQQDDSDDDLLQGENTTDIAASIQALARSVNGDTVFGDLPRNICRTHI